MSLNVNVTNNSYNKLSFTELTLPKLCKDVTHKYFTSHILMKELDLLEFGL